MAETDLTYAQIRTRIAGELNREDLDTTPLSSSSVIHQYFLDRVLYYSQNFIFPGPFIDTKATVAGEPYVDLSDGWQDVSVVKLLNGSTYTTLAKVDRDVIIQSDNQSPANQAQPSMYALFINPATNKMALRLFSVPNAVYALEITMDKPPAAPTADADSNFWTNEAQTLMISSVVVQLCKRRINRPMKAQEHQSIVDDIEATLNSKAIRAAGGLRFKPHYY